MAALLEGSKKWLKFQYESQEWINYLLDVTRPIPSNQIRLLIFGQGRTGSTLLENLLSSTGYFRQNGELLGTEKGEILYPIRYIRGLSKRHSKENLIFHVKIYQLTRDRRHPIDPAQFLKTLYEEGWKILYLRRKNKVQHALSSFVALHRGHYFKFTDNDERLRLLIDCDRFVEKMYERFRHEEAEKEVLKGITYHEIVYEDDLEKADTHQRTIDRILDFVSLEHRTATTNLKKVNTQSPQELIVNYDEFVDCLVKNNWQNFLECDRSLS